MVQEMEKGKESDVEVVIEDRELKVYCKKKSNSTMSNQAFLQLIENQYG